MTDYAQVMNHINFSDLLTLLCAPQVEKFFFSYL